MNAQTASYVDAIDHLPPGATLLIPHVSWDEYEQLLQDLGQRPDLRVTYDDGRLEVMTLSDQHEEFADDILGLARLFSQELGITLETRGSATRRRQRVRKGTEPDQSFWVANAHRIIGKRRIDLDTDPPPDVVVEVDITKDSRGKFSIYAALGVPEIWRCDGTRVQMYELRATAYGEVEASRFFPGLTCAFLLEFLELSNARGQTAALAAFRERIRAGLTPS
jgi:Uma2 family endonuclease